MKIYVVVENAGYEGECTVFRSPSLDVASRWMNKSYSQDEIQDLHVDIAAEEGGERTYEI